MHNNHTLDKALTNLRESLNKYSLRLAENPNSIFYRGAVKNTKELINELESLEKQKEGIEAKLKGLK